MIVRSTMAKMGHSNCVWSASFSPDSSKIASGSDDKTVKLWDVTSGECLQTLKGHSDIVWSVSFSPDGTKVASGSDDNTVKLWDVTSGECTFTGDADVNGCVGFHGFKLQIKDDSAVATDSNHKIHILKLVC